MKKVAWITDSTSFFKNDFAEKNDIFIAPLGVSFENETYRDGVDISIIEFYQKLEHSKNLPKTSQPSIGDFISLYEKLKEEYEFGFAVHLSSELSGTFHTSKQAADIVGFPVYMIDSKLLSLPMSELILKGKELINSGFSADEVAVELSNLSSKNKLFVMVGSLEQLHKGGRVSSLQLMMGSLLQIKPILTIENGKVIPFDKVRSEKKAINYMVDLLKKDILNEEKIKKVFILHGNAEPVSHLLYEKVKELKDDIPIETGTIGPAIGVHTGSGTIAISWFVE
jgi:DegV family protein with EDD domain